MKLTVISKNICKTKSPQNAEAIFLIDKNSFKHVKPINMRQRNADGSSKIILLYFCAPSFIYSLIFIYFILFIYSFKVYFSVVKSAMEIQNIIIIVMVIVVITLYS